VIVIDREQYRLDHVKKYCQQVEVRSYGEVDDLLDTLKEMTPGREPDAVIDTVGFEAHGDGLGSLYDEVKHAVKLETDRPITIREAIMAVRNGGNLSIVGDYIGLADKFPLGSFMNRGLTVKTGQRLVQRYLPQFICADPEGRGRSDIRDNAQGQPRFEDPAWAHASPMTTGGPSVRCSGPM
jgi:threonine dehydrogenase-like Zn-dependent dehydrogenase